MNELICCCARKNWWFGIAVYVGGRWAAYTSSESSDALQVELRLWEQDADCRVKCYWAEHWTVSSIHLLLVLQSVNSVSWVARRWPWSSDDVLLGYLLLFAGCVGVVCSSYHQTNNRIDLISCRPLWNRFLTRVWDLFLSLQLSVNYPNKIRIVDTNLIHIDLFSISTWSLQTKITRAGISTSVMQHTVITKEHRVSLWVNKHLAHSIVVCP